MKTRLTLVVLLLLTLLVAACQPQGAPVPQDPLEAVKTIADKQTDVKTQHVEHDHGAQPQARRLDGRSAQMRCDVQELQGQPQHRAATSTTPRKISRLKGDLDLGALTTFLTQGEDKLLFEVVKSRRQDVHQGQCRRHRQQMAGARYAKATEAEVTKDNPLSPEMVMDLLKQSSKAEKLADEKIGDMDTYHYKVTLDPDTLVDSIAMLAESTGAGATMDQAQMDEAKKYLKDSTLEVELWAGKSGPIAAPGEGPLQFESERLARSARRDGLDRLRVHQYRQQAQRAGDHYGAEVNAAFDLLPDREALIVVAMVQSD